MNKSVLLLSILFLAGCATEVAKTPVATGGSRADASVEMSFDRGLFEAPVVDWTAAEQSALKRCRAWGYGNVSAFEGLRTQCQQYDPNFGCVLETITRTYQCTN